MLIIVVSFADIELLTTLISYTTIPRIVGCRRPKNRIATERDVNISVGIYLTAVI